MPRAFALRLDMPDPADAGALAAALSTGVLRADAVRAVLIKTPGNGLTNDFSRDLAARSVAAVLRAHGAVLPMILPSGGVEGIAVPHMLLLGREEGDVASPDRRLALGFARGEALAGSAIGTAVMAEAVAATVAAAMRDARLAGGDVALAIVKAPLPTPSDFGGDHAALKARARGAAALGVMAALGELDAARLATVAICNDASLFSSRALVAAGTDVMAPEVLVLGMGMGWGGDLVAASAALDDMLDARGFRAVLARSGLSQLPDDGARVAALLVKGAMPAQLRGTRPAAHDDDDIHPNRHWRAAMSGVIGALTGDLRPFLSGGGEHQGPPGGVTVAVIARTGQGE
ncbi:ring-opening amidohydrolase [Elioraea sp.]|uniref:ring-opening amidohydrolase n=1 Tax=Elioraea sp. TaxID=2185103 RepID=UPI0025C62DA8|nr:ring-opening amidohydrolase [Elioraea sp.]